MAKDCWGLDAQTWQEPDQERSRQGQGTGEGTGPHLQGSSCQTQSRLVEAGLQGEEPPVGKSPSQPMLYPLGMARLLVSAWKAPIPVTESPEEMCQEPQWGRGVCTLAGSSSVG